MIFPSVSDYFEFDLMIERGVPCTIWHPCHIGTRRMADSRRNSICLLVSLVFLFRGIVAVVGLIRSPQSQVIPKQLHDKSGVLVGFFVQSIKFRNGIIESLR
jgi:hypothetical protein